MRILVTGASGLLGSKIAEASSNKGHEVYSGYKRNRPSTGIPIKFDISNESEVEGAFKDVRPEVVIHAAALTNVDECEVNKGSAWKVNVLATRNIAAHSRRRKAFLVYVSSDYVFDGTKGMYTEDDNPYPINYYGLTKLEGEREVLKLLKDYCIARPSVIYGAKPASGKTNFALWILESLKKDKPINVVTDQWNSPTLNTNLAEMILEVSERRLKGVYHLAGASRVSRYEFAKLIAEAFNLNRGLIRPITSDKMAWTAKRPMDSSLNVSKAANTLQNKPLEARSAVESLKREIESMNITSLS